MRAISEAGQTPGRFMTKLLTISPLTRRLHRNINPAILGFTDPGGLGQEPSSAMTASEFRWYMAKPYVTTHKRARK
jgi:hypothetical protein